MAGRAADHDRGHARRGGRTRSRPGSAAGTSFLRNVSDPTLTVFTPPEGTGNGVGVIVAPGGGWTILAWVHEGLDVARWLTAAGYTAFLLKYRVQASDPDQAAFEAAMAAMDGLHAVPLPTALRPRRHRRPDLHQGVPQRPGRRRGRRPAGDHDRSRARADVRRCVPTRSG